MWDSNVFGCDSEIPLYIHDRWVRGCDIKLRIKFSYLVMHDNLFTNFVMLIIVLCFK